MIEWWYGKDGRQFGPFTKEALLDLHQKGTLSQSDLVWSKGMADWQPFGTVFGPELAAVPPSLSSGSPLVSSPSLGGAGKSMDYGDLLCWGIAGILIPCLGLAVGIGLIVLMTMEVIDARARVLKAELKATDYSNLHPVLLVLGLVCCAIVFYPIFMHLRNKSGYYKPQPHAVWFAIAIMVVNLGVAVIFGVLNSVATMLSQGGYGS
jgi:hypothetical protein